MKNHILLLKKQQYQHYNQMYGIQSKLFLILENLKFILMIFSKHNTHNLYILQKCTMIVYNLYKLEQKILLVLKLCVLEISKLNNTINYLKAHLYNKVEQVCILFHRDKL